MKDKVLMHNLVERIPTHRETVTKCHEEIENLKSIVVWLEDAYGGGSYDAAKVFLTEAEQSIEMIRTLVGASRTDGARQVEKEDGMKCRLLYLG